MQNQMALIKDSNTWLPFQMFPTEKFKIIQKLPSKWAWSNPIPLNLLDMEI